MKRYRGLDKCLSKGSILLASFECGDTERGRRTEKQSVLSPPITNPIAHSLQTPQGVGYTPRSVFRELLESSSVQLHPHHLP